MTKSTKRSSRKTRGGKKTYFKMAASSGNTDEFDCQAKACEEFFQELLPKVQNLKPLENDYISENAKKFKGPIYDITNFDAREVVALMSRIVNDRKEFTRGKTFYLLLRNGQENEPEELFRLKARPTKNHPGNAIVFLRPRGRKTFKTSAKSYEALKGELEAHYEEDTASFASDIRTLFKNNAVIINDLPQATFEVYTILLFEIARRLVELEDPSDEKVQFDVLPIGSAIARIVKLLELGRKDICTFDDVFFSKHKFHCFTGKPEDRRKAIDKINETTLEIAKKKWMERNHALTHGVSVCEVRVPMLVAAPDLAAKVFAMQVNRHLEELKQMFCSQEQQEAMLAKQFELGMKLSGSTAWLTKTKKSARNTEILSAFDYT